MGRRRGECGASYVRLAVAAAGGGDRQQPPVVVVRVHQRRAAVPDLFRQAIPRTYVAVATEGTIVGVAPIASWGADADSDSAAAPRVNRVLERLPTGRAVR